MSPPIRLGLCLAVCGLLLRAQPVVSGVVNGASFETGVAPGCLVSIFGSNLAPSTAGATALPLPATLAGVSVTVGTRPAPLYFVSPGQINAQIPFDAPPGSTTLVVSTGAGRSAQASVTLQATAPGLFTRTADGRGRALVFNLRFEPVETLMPGEVVILYATGLGATNPAAVTGAGGAAAEPLQRAATTPEVYFGEAPARVLYAGLAPGFAGVYQLNVVAPAGMTTNRVFARSEGRRSNIAEADIPEGQSADGATGAIEFLYPYPTTEVTFSPALLVVRYRVRVEVRETRPPFFIAAVTENASALTLVQPAIGRWEAQKTVPTFQASFWDFSGTDITPIDLLAGGRPFPGAVVPLSRVDPQAQQALFRLPMPSLPPGPGTPRSATGIYQVSGSLSRGTPFLVDDDNNFGLSDFAGYLAIPYASAIRRRGTTASLFVDGRRVASSDISFEIQSGP